MYVADSCMTHNYHRSRLLCCSQAMFKT